MDYIKNKVSQRLGVLQRIKHLLPRDTRELFVKAMVLLNLDYADVTWGDKSNTTLMNKIQLLQNKAAKLILNMPIENIHQQQKPLIYLVGIHWKKGFSHGLGIDCID